jgi:lipid A ethanolaminephosphotransferase
MQNRALAIRQRKQYFLAFAPRPQAFQCGRLPAARFSKTIAMIFPNLQRRPALSSKAAIFILSLYFSTVLNAALWHYLQENLPFNDFGTALLWIWFPLFIFLFNTVVFNLLCWPYLAKPLGALLLLCGGVATWAMLRYGIMIDSSMIRNVFETNRREALDYVNFANILGPVLLGALPAACLCLVRIHYAPPMREAFRHMAFIVGSLVLFGATTALAYKYLASFGRNHRQMQRLVVPYNYVQGSLRYWQRVREANRPFQTIDASPTLSPAIENNPKRTIVVLAIGESSRAMNYSLAGYARDTNPELSKESLVSFKDTLSVGTYTALSVPSIFSYLPRKKFKIEDAPRTQNLLDIAQKAGYDVLWIDNDDGCKGVCKRVPTIISSEKTSPKYCNKDFCYDDALLDGLEEKIRNGKKNMLVVLHLLGSHGPAYFQRYPAAFRKFTPTCDTNEIRNCTKAQITNTYDNTIVYTDHVLDEAIQILKKIPDADTGLLYVSDHGESLGENGIYLHGIPYAFAPIEQKHVPMLLWMNDAMQRSDKIDYACLKAKADEPLTQDYIFHSVVKWLGIQTKVYDPQYDFLASCMPKGK